MDIPSYITGLVDGEGCFCISFSKRQKLATGIEVRPSFSLSQNERNAALVQMVQSFFACGNIRYSKSDQTYKYEVRSLRDLKEVIIPFFEKYPLLGIKAEDFHYFKEVCGLVDVYHHRNSEKLLGIISLAYRINYSGKRKLTEQELLQLVTR